MKSALKKWGNSAAVLIPAAVLETVLLRIGDTVDVCVEAGRIVIQPIPKRACDINQLIKEITSNNLHGAADFGPAAGKEVW